MQVNNLNERIDMLENANTGSSMERLELEWYRELSDKTDTAIARILTVVGTCFTCFSIFSLLLAFRAPHDIDKRIEELRVHSDLERERLRIELKEAKQFSEDAKYQAILARAINKPDAYGQIRELTKVIKTYPDKADAYFYRGCAYDDNKDYPHAIVDYNFAFQRGYSAASYYNVMGVTYSNQSQNKEAVEFYTRAIQEDPVRADTYCNRACAYDELEEFEAALADYSKTLELDTDHYYAYFNRSLTYEKLFQRAEDPEEKAALQRKIIADLKHAQLLNPNDKSAQLRLRQQVRKIENGSQNIIPELMLAEICTKIGDLECEDANIGEAVKNYFEAITHYSSIDVGKEAQIEKISPVLDKIAAVLHEHPEAIVEIKKYNIRLLSSHLAQKGYLAYEEGDHATAEYSFRLARLFDTDAGKNACLNLAYMRRRGETMETTESAVELLEECAEPKSSIWSVNKALCAMDGIGCEPSWVCALDCMKEISGEAKDAFLWWADVDRVGARESNAVLLLLKMSNTYDFPDECSIEDRKEQAVRDGYTVE